MKNATNLMKHLENISKLKYIMSLDDNIKDIFDIIERCRNNISYQEIRDIEKRSLLFAEEIIKERKEILSDPYFSDVQETFAKYEKTCLALIESYREEISLYE